MLVVVVAVVDRCRVEFLLCDTLICLDSRDKSSSKERDRGLLKGSNEPNCDFGARLAAFPPRSAAARNKARAKYTLDPMFDGSAISVRFLAPLLG